jgi:GNAT superfamily N-acetyltransferase
MQSRPDGDHHHRRAALIVRIDRKLDSGRHGSSGIVEPMAEMTILPATIDRWADVRALLDSSGEQGCWCQAWRGADAKSLSGGKSRPDLLHEQMQSGPPPPGFLAYLDGVPVGWVGVGLRSETPRLMRSRTIPAIDDLPVWSIGCFRIRPGYRRRGVARALLAGVVDAARRAGAPGVEAYPIDPQGGRVEVGAGFVGIASMFDAAGFRRVLVTDAKSGGLPRHLVRLELQGAQAR